MTQNAIPTDEGMENMKEQLEDMKDRMKEIGYINWKERQRK